MLTALASSTVGSATQGITQTGNVTYDAGAGNTLTVDGAVTGTTIAAAIGPGLAKAALAMEVDGKLRDLSATIDRLAAYAEAGADCLYAPAVSEPDAIRAIVQGQRTTFYCPRCQKN